MFNPKCSFFDLWHLEFFLSIYVQSCLVRNFPHSFEYIAVNNLSLSIPTGLSTYMGSRSRTLVSGGLEYTNKEHTGFTFGMCCADESIRF